MAREYDNTNELALFCAEHGWKLETLRRRIREFKQYQTEFNVELAQEIKLSEGKEIKYLDYPMLSGDKVIISDIEMPDQFTLMLKLAVLVGMARDIKDLLVAGDAIATDQAALTSWVTTWVRGDMTYEDAVEGSLAHNLREMGKWFNRIVALEGNHDDRVARVTGGMVHLGMLLRAVPKVEYSRYEYCYVETKRGMVYVTHPANFAQDPITLGQQLYAVEQGPHFDPLNPFNTFQKCHVVLGHCHRQQFSMSPDGVFEIHSLGTLRHPHKTMYLKKKATKFRKWDSGFLVNQNGYFYPMKLNGTDWYRELGGYDGYYGLVADELEMLRYPQGKATA